MLRVTRAGDGADDEDAGPRDVGSSPPGVVVHARPEDAWARAQGLRERFLAEAPGRRRADAVGLGAADLRRLYELYDATFFSGRLETLRRALGDVPLELRFSGRLRTSAGRTVTWRLSGTRTVTRYVVEVGLGLLALSYGAVGRVPTVNGRPCPDRLDAVLRVLEHELLHLFQMLVTDDTDCRGPAFRDLSRSVFGHLDTTHALVTGAERARVVFGVRAGDRVAFTFRGVRHEGVVNRVTARATVLVPDETGETYVCRSTGAEHRYRKFYVPVDDLEPLGPPRG